MKQYIELNSVLDSILNTSSRKAKESILHKESDNKEVRRLLVKYFELKSNPYLNFNTTKYKGPTPVGKSPYTDTDMDEFFTLMETLHTSKVRGTESTKLLNTFLNKYPDYLEFMNSFLGEPIRLGISANTVKDVYPELSVPGFGIKLCAGFNSELAYKSTWLVQPKYDGLRAVIMFDDDEPRVYSRNGKPLYNCELISEFIKENVPSYQDYVYDGELFTKDWNSSMSISRSVGVHPKRDELRLILFTMVPRYEWDESAFGISEFARHSVVISHFPSDDITTNYVVPVDSSLVPKSEDDSEVTWTDKLIETMDKFISQGYEGAVIKKFDSPYSFDRNDDWMKLKRWYTADFKILEVLEGNGRLANNCGKVVLDVEGVIVRCGSGLTDAMRKHLWDNRNTIADTYVEVKYQEITKDGSLRFPIFKRLREDK